MRSLQGRLLAATGILALVALVAVALAARHGARRELETFVALESSGSRDDLARSLAAIAAAHPAGLSAAELQAAASRLPPNAAALLVDARGSLVAACGEGLSGFSVRTHRAGQEVVAILRREDRRHQLLGELRVRGRGVPVGLTGGSAGELLPLLLPSPRQGRHAAAVLGSLDQRLLIATGLAAATALLLTWAVARRVLAPIRQLQEAARDLARGRLERRVSASGPAEIAELGRAFNGMAAELEHQQQLRRDLVNDVAHELRAPLTAMLCRLDAAKDGLERDPASSLEGFHGDVFHLASLVEDLQELSLAEAGQLRLNFQHSSVPAAVNSAVRAAGLDGDARLRLDVYAAPEVFADPIRLQQVLVNLLTNAGRHTPAEGHIQVHAEGRDGEVLIEVTDSGCGLAPEQLSRVFERFYRTDGARRREAVGGSGLGLAIVKSLIELQHGRVWARSAPGEGATFGFSVPRAGQPGASGPA